ncbi:magnesium transporter [uncultured Levyella sp.]|uniref:magnesium transporter n=1 Tax=uncultured Levyella sp. TaxID=1715800 RepID=UPI00258D9144|nr:magnesium transporter [uncultured Levyella sp.]
MPIEEIIAHGNAREMEKLFEKQEPIDIAHALEDATDDETTHFLSLVSDEHLANILEDAEPKERNRLVGLLGNHRLLFIFPFMEKDDIVDILGEMEIGRQKSLMNLMKTEDRRIITDLLHYPPESAGGIMTTQYLALRNTMTVEEGFNTIRKIGPRTEQIETIYIVDDKKKLMGYVDLRDLLSASAGDLIAQYVETNVISVAPEADQEVAARLVSKYDLNSIPVVSNGIILGIITVDDIIDVIQQEHEEDMAQMAGASVEEDLSTPLATSVKLRLPWLLINLLTAFLASSIVNVFQSTIEQVVALSAIMTIISGMGGNAGSQTMSIIIRYLAKDGIDREDSRRQLVKEILNGVINGLINGFLTAIVVVVVYHNLFLGGIVILAMVGNMIIGGIFGLTIPIALKKIGFDPAIASSIFLTTATDTLGFFLLLGLAQLFMPLLMG